jgi:hypothetical protein
MPDEKPNPQPPQTPAPGGAPTPTLETLIPEEFKNRAYLNDLKALPVGPDGYSALFKKLDGAQTLIGKKTGVPEQGAAPEAWEEFHKLTRPGKAEEYEFTVAEGVQADEEFLGAMRGMFYEAGVSKAQAKKLQAGYEKFVVEKYGAQVAERKRLDAEFQQLMTSTFGTESKAKFDTGKALLSQLTPDSLKPHLNRLSNESLVVLTGIMSTVKEKFMKEDGSFNGSGGTPPVGEDENGLHDKGRKLMASEAYTNFRHPEHAKVVADVGAIYKKLGDMKTAAGNKK